jgi:hypothetical protein
MARAVSRVEAWEGRAASIPPGVYAAKKFVKGKDWMRSAVETEASDELRLAR